MAQYIFVYIGGDYPTDPQQGQEHFQRYQQWLMSLGEKVLSPAIPFKDTHTVHPDGKAEQGTVSAMSGMSIMQFNSMDEAVAAAKSCPFREINGTLEVSEMIDMNTPSEGGKPN